MKCWLAGCDQPIDYEVTARWSWFDFRTEMVCADHYSRLYRVLLNSTVDGLPPEEMETVQVDSELQRSL
jgi:hypothetical protein